MKKIHTILDFIFKIALILALSFVGIQLQPLSKIHDSINTLELYASAQCDQTGTIIKTLDSIDLSLGHLTLAAIHTSENTPTTDDMKEITRAIEDCIPEFSLRQLRTSERKLNAALQTIPPAK